MREGGHLAALVVSAISSHHLATHDIAARRRGLGGMPVRASLPRDVRPTARSATGRRRSFPQWTAINRRRRGQNTGTVVDLLIKNRANGRCRCGRGPGERSASRIQAGLWNRRFSDLSLQSSVSTVSRPPTPAAAGLDFSLSLGSAELSRSGLTGSSPRCAIS